MIILEISLKAMAMAYLPEHPTPFLRLTKSCIAKHAVLLCNCPCDSKRFTICAKESGIPVTKSCIRSINTTVPTSMLAIFGVTINQIIHKVCCKVQHKVMHLSETCDVTTSAKHGGPATVTRHPSCSVRTRTRTRPVTPAVGAVENQRRTTLLQKAPKQTPRHSNTQTSNEIDRAKHTQNISKRFQPKALTSSYWHPSQVYRIPFPCLRLHRSWEALMPRPLRQKPTFLIATGCCGKNCDMAYFTVETLILGCITNLMKSTHWKPVNFQNIQLGFMLTTSLLEGRLSVMSTLGKTPVIDGEEFTGTRGAEKKTIWQRKGCFVSLIFVSLHPTLGIENDMCNLRQRLLRAPADSWSTWWIPPTPVPSKASISWWPRC